RVMRVLVAEDDAMSRRLLQILLEQWGHEVVTAETGVKAWSLLEQEAFPLLITDWMMPEMDGLELIRRVRAADRLKYVYILLLTAKTLKEDLIRGMEAGANDYVTKPFDREELRVRLRAGERIVKLEQALSEQNRELHVIRKELEERVNARTLDLARTNEELRAEAAERQRGAKELAATQEKLVQSEREKREFYREVIRCVTKDKFHLVDRSEMPTEGELILDAPLNEIEDYPALRMELRRICAEHEMDSDLTGDFVLAVGEAATNAIKHAEKGRCLVYDTGDRLIARVEDNGSGIRTENLAPTILLPGFSTQVSMGMGYTIMLETVDRVWLSTGPEGTQVQLEKWIRPEDRPDPQFQATLDRFGDECQEEFTGMMNGIVGVEEADAPNEGDPEGGENPSDRPS
ncbi:MAG: response regulator, partial [Armatimonadetes bacterium]|nr:response regulator [Armatimonadota bacterium]